MDVDKYMSSMTHALPATAEDDDDAEDGGGLGLPTVDLAALRAVLLKHQVRQGFSILRCGCMNSSFSLTHPQKKKTCADSGDGQHWRSIYVPFSLLLMIYVFYFRSITEIFRCCPEMMGEGNYGICIAARQTILPLSSNHGFFPSCLPP